MQTSTETFIGLSPSGDLTASEIEEMRRMVLAVMQNHPKENEGAIRAAHALLQALDLWEIVKTRPNRTCTANACRSLQKALVNLQDA